MLPDPIERTTHTLFEEEYWLEAAAPGAWHTSEVHQNGKLIGRLPYAFKRKHGLRLITQPAFTPWLGPWIKSSGGKQTNELSHQHQVLEKLISQLPACDIAAINCAPEFANLMALHWVKFKLTTGYTHRLNNLADENILWDGLRDTVRRLCRKAEKVTVVTKHRSIGEFIALHEKTFQRQGQDVSSTFATLERIDAVMAARDQRAIYTAEDAQGRLHSGVYIVYDERHSFYLAGGGDPELRDSGGHALAMWHAIKESGARSKTFDFVGSSVPAIEYFVRGFGPEQTHRYSATRVNGLGKLWTAFQALKS
jgi:Acetyltransferase (GNAT) domain